MKGAAALRVCPSSRLLSLKRWSAKNSTAAQSAAQARAVASFRFMVRAPTHARAQREDDANEPLLLRRRQQQLLDVATFRAAVLPMVERMACETASGPGRLYLRLGRKLLETGRAVVQFLAMAKQAALIGFELHAFGKSPRATCQVPQPVRLLQEALLRRRLLEHLVSMRLGEAMAVPKCRDADRRATSPWSPRDPTSA